MSWGIYLISSPGNLLTSELGLVNIPGALWRLNLSFHPLNVTNRSSSHAPFLFGMFISGFFQREGKLDCRKNVYVHPKANHKLLRETFLSKLHVPKSVLALQTINNSFENLVTIWCRINETNKCLMTKGEIHV